MLIMERNRFGDVFESWTKMIAFHMPLIPSVAVDGMIVDVEPSYQ